MKIPRWAIGLITLGIMAITYFVVVHTGSEGFGTRIGSWAQLLAALATVLAAWLALATARENREQAKIANRALTAATRPRITLSLMPAPKAMKHCAPNQAVSLAISNNSAFDVPKCRVSWTTKSGLAKVVWVDQLSADPDSSTGFISEGVSRAGGAKSSVSVPLGELNDWDVDNAQVMFFYASPFHNGGWMEVHKWPLWNTSSDPATPAHYESRHTVGDPTWMSLSDIGF